MKISNKKIIVSTLALAMGAALAGSISGSVAWYQYSTRATAAFIGSSAHSTHNLQISTDGSDWQSDITSAELIAATLDDHDGSKFSPITPGMNITPSSADQATVPTDPFKGQPRAHHFAYSEWEDADDHAYLQFDLWFRVLDVDGKEDVPAEAQLLAKDLYFTDITIEGHSKKVDPNPITGDDFDDAIRILVEDKTTGSTVKPRLFSLNGTDTNLYGALDLDSEPGNETVGRYEWDELDGSGNKVEGIYGATYISPSAGFDATTEYVEKSLAFGDYLADDTGSDLDVTGATALGTTAGGAAAGAQNLHYQFTIWLEGWDAAGGSAIWDVADFIGDFHIGLSFGVENHQDH